mmetsp:Transcript_93331/g.273235  ORF Transcript_93331/g.273235 Transcript_93331/m.273235 type:complete len:121 (+) Transcript_93331:148-510(+)
MPRGTAMTAAQSCQGLQTTCCALASLYKLKCMAVHFSAHDARANSQEAWHANAHAPPTARRTWEAAVGIAIERAACLAAGRPAACASGGAGAAALPRAVGDGSSSAPECVRTGSGAPTSP